MILYLTEITLPENRAFYNILFLNMWAVSSFLIFCLGFGLQTDPNNTENKYWIFLLGFCGIICIMHLFGFLFCFKYDTPMYYMQKAKKSQNSIEKEKN